jgi:hypothetical protein
MLKLILTRRSQQGLLKYTKFSRSRATLKKDAFPKPPSSGIFQADCPANFQKSRDKQINPVYKLLPYKEKPESKSDSGRSK